MANVLPLFLSSPSYPYLEGNPYHSLGFFPVEAQAILREELMHGVDKYLNVRLGTGHNFVCTSMLQIKMLFWVCSGCVVCYLGVLGIEVDKTIHVLFLFSTSPFSDSRAF